MAKMETENCDLSRDCNDGSIFEHMKRICKTCEYWKTYMRLENSNACACVGRSSGCNPFAQLYTNFDDTCDVWTKRIKLHFKKFRDSIKN